jgi:predicted DNA-binding transcriptional regulator AlpA
MSADVRSDAASEAAGRSSEARPVGRYRMADAVPFHERLLVGWDDVSAHVGVSRRLLEREVSAGRMPAPDVRIGRRACWRPSTITTWIDSMAQQARPHGRHASA